MKMRVVLAAALGVALSAILLGGTVASAAPPARPEAVTPVANPEMLYVAIPTCRIVDTRLGGGALTNGTTRSFFVGGTTGFAPQGGKSGGCGIPASATVVSGSVIATAETGSGYLKEFPANAAEPLSSILNYNAHTTVNVGLPLLVQANGSPSMKIRNLGATTHLVVDVFGYYIDQMEISVDSNGTVLSGSPRITLASHTQTGVYTFLADRDLSGCSVQATEFGFGGYVTALTSQRAIFVFSWVIDNPTQLPFKAFDVKFNLMATC
jgi:hypothetical protein